MSIRRSCGTRRWGRRWVFRSFALCSLSQNDEVAVRLARVVKVLPLGTSEISRSGLGAHDQVAGREPLPLRFQDEVNVLPLIAVIVNQVRDLGKDQPAFLENAVRFI